MRFEKPEMLQGVRSMLEPSIVAYIIRTKVVFLAKLNFGLCIYLVILYNYITFLQFIQVLFFLKF